METWTNKSRGDHKKAEVHEQNTKANVAAPDVLGAGVGIVVKFSAADGPLVATAPCDGAGVPALTGGGAIVSTTGAGVAATSPSGAGVTPTGALVRAAAGWEVGADTGRDVGGGGIGAGVSGSTGAGEAASTGDPVGATSSIGEGVGESSPHTNAPAEVGGADATDRSAEEGFPGVEKSRL